MNNYHIAPASNAIADYLTEKNVQFERKGAQIKLTSFMSRDVKKDILKACDERKTSLFDGRPRQNFSNLIAHIL